MSESNEPGAPGTPPNPPVSPVPSAGESDSGAPEPTSQPAPPLSSPDPTSQPSVSPPPAAPSAPPAPPAPNDPEAPGTPEAPRFRSPFEQQREAQGFTQSSDSQPTSALPEQGASGFDAGQQPTTVLPPVDGAQGFAAGAASTAPPAPPAPTAPQQGGSAGYPAGSPQAPMNALALVAFIGSFFVSLVGIICGHISLKQIKRTGERGRGFALAGTIIGYVSLAATIVAIIIGISFAMFAVSAANESISQLEQSSQDYQDDLDSLQDDFAGTESDLGTEEDTSSDFSASSDERSPEFCAALDEALNIESDPNSFEFSPAELAAFEKLAGVESPNRAVYEKFLGIASDPASIAQDADAQSLFSEFTEAMFDDTMACM